MARGCRDHSPWANFSSETRLQILTPLFPLLDLQFIKNTDTVYTFAFCLCSKFRVKVKKKKTPLVCWNFWGRGDLFFISLCTSHFINNLSQCSKAEIKQTPTWSFCVHNVGSAVPLISLHLLAPAPSPLAKARVFCSGACTALSFTWHAAWADCCWLGSRNGDSPPWPHFYSSFIFNFLFTKSCTWLGLTAVPRMQLNQNLISVTGWIKAVFWDRQSHVTQRQVSSSSLKEEAGDPSLGKCTYGMSSKPAQRAYWI